MSDNYPFRRFGGEWRTRLREAWWIVTGKWSLHRAWQKGHDEGCAFEWRRIVKNGGDIAGKQWTPNGLVLLATRTEAAGT